MSAFTRRTFSIEYYYCVVVYFICDLIHSIICGSVPYHLSEQQAIFTTTTTTTRTKLSRRLWIKLTLQPRTTIFIYGIIKLAVVRMLPRLLDCQHLCTKHINLELKKETKLMEKLLINCTKLDRKFFFLSWSAMNTWVGYNLSNRTVRVLRLRHFLSIFFFIWCFWCANSIST